MRAIKIDTIKKEVYEVQQKNIKEIYAHIGCNCFCQVGRRLITGDILLVDDEGLYKKDKGAFKFGHYPQLLSGSGLIIGTDQAGETINAQGDLDYIKSIVVFGDAKELPSPSFEIREVKDIEDLKKIFGN